MNIFVIPSSYKSEFNTQANIFVHEQCEALIKMGHKVTVLDATTRSRKQWSHRICKKPEVRFEDNVKVYSYWVRGIAKKKLARLATAQFKNKISVLWDMAVREEGRPDVIYAHFTFPSGFCSLDLSEKYGVPLVIMEHAGMYLTNNINSYLASQLTLAVNGADKFFCVSGAHEKSIRDITKTNADIQVVPNMISSKFSFFPLEASENFVFFSAGNLKPVKRFDLLIKAFCRSFAKDAPVSLLIAGEGEEREKLETLIAHMNREKQIKLLGRLDRDSMLEGYKKCNCFALASEHESFGVVYREAAACGRPIVSTLNGGIEEGWDDSFGYTVPCDDEAALAEALLAVYNNYSDFSLKSISYKTLSYCSESVIMNKIENILLQAAGDNNGNN